MFCTSLGVFGLKDTIVSAYYSVAQKPYFTSLTDSKSLSLPGRKALCFFEITNDKLSLNDLLIKVFEIIYIKHCKN